MNFKAIWAIIKETFQDWSEDKASRLAAALSYYTIFSLAPLLVLVIAITSLIIGNNVDVRQQIITQVQGLVGQQGAEAVNTLIENSSEPSGGILATVIGFVLLIVGATGVFGQLQDALNTIWEIQPKKGGGIIQMVKDRFLSFTMVLGISFLLLVSLVISAALSFVNAYFSDLLGGFGFLAQVVNFVISIGVVTVIFAMLFRYLPDIDIPWGDVWIGALVTAVLFTIGRQLISLYLAQSAPASTYGAAGSLVILLLWVYYSAQILFLGAEFTQVYSRKYGSRALAANEKGRPMTDSERAKQGIPKREPAIEGVRQSFMPVTGQPTLHIREGSGEGSAVQEMVDPARERIRYTAPNPARVVPVIAGGVLASALTIQRIARKVTSGRETQHSKHAGPVMQIRQRFNRRWR